MNNSCYNKPDKVNINLEKSQFLLVPQPLVQRRRGFSLLEIIITIAILAILLAIGVPYFAKSKANTSLRTQAKELKVSLSYARSQAKSTGSNTEWQFTGPTNEVSGYNLLDSTGRVVKSVVFNGGTYVDITGLSGTPLEYSPNGSSTEDGIILVKGKDTNKYFTLTLVKTTGLVKITETN
ncbi:MAG: prepilin-type N-terminal cleavage/methylation domain-containing protein [Candidatus Eremiobacteraeota bacterium]|nr:prepilin-type N-terminal cleavage/methylation domain-containing protein [Candidatus Eremiobacteraeota bacterium]